MKRRAAIRRVVLLSAGAALLHGCRDKASPEFARISLTGPQEDLMADLTEAILPTTDFIGASGLKSHEFVLIMADDCASPEDLAKFMEGMGQFDEAFRKKYGSAFAGAPESQQNEFLATLETATGLSESVVFFYGGVKGLTIQSFTSSEEYLTQVRKFSLIPEPFNGCVPVSQA